jgi:hypothetical protein
VGGGGGISSVPWWRGFLCHSTLLLRNFFDTWSFMWARETMDNYAALLAAFPASASAPSLPGVPSCPVIQVFFAVWYWRASWVTMPRILLAKYCPGPDPVCPARAIALVQSECMIRQRYGEGPNHLTASYIAATSASKAVCLAPSVLAPWATASPAPILSSVMIHPKPADLRNEPSVQAWHVSISGMSGPRAVHSVGHRGRVKVCSMFPLL